MKKTYFCLIACALLLAMASIPYAYAHHMYEDYPAGIDIMDPTTAVLGLEIIGVGVETVMVNGSTSVNRSNPYDPGDGHWKIDTEIISMNLEGTSALVGEITIIESPTRASNGTIQQQVAGEDFPADSFFDVFVEINTTLPFPLSTLHTDEPLPMDAVIFSIPPWEAIYIPPDPPIEIPLKDQNGKIVGFITHVAHEIPPAVPEFPLGLELMMALAPVIPIVYLWRNRKKA